MCKTPCPECAYTKDAMPGYFGGNHPEDFKRAIHSEQAMPCHMRSKYNAAGDVIADKVVVCRGQVLAQIKSAKRAYNPDIVAVREELESSEAYSELLEKNLSAFDFSEHHGLD